MDNIEKKRAPGRPRAFDEAAVLNAARQAFLQQGFEALSTDQLAASMGLSKPSLYNSFGDKEAVFARVLDDYADMALFGITASVAGHKSLREAADAMLQGGAAIYAGEGKHSIGCLLIGTSLPAATTHESVQTIVTRFVTTLDTALGETFASEYGAELKKRGQSAEQMAWLFSGLLFSLAVRARMGLSRRALNRVAADLAGTI